MIMNLTPHDLNVRDETGTIQTIPKSGVVARVKAERTLTGEVDGFLVYRTTFGEIEGLPLETGAVYVVSRLVLDAAKDRTDLVAPGELIRDSDGTVVGCDGFSK